jgi:hypothetical protein
MPSHEVNVDDNITKQIEDVKEEIKETKLKIEKTEGEIEEAKGYLQNAIDEERIKYYQAYILNLQAYILNLQKEKSKLREERNTLLQRLPQQFEPTGEFFQLFLLINVSTQFGIGFCWQDLLSLLSFLSFGKDIDHKSSMKLRSLQSSKSSYPSPAMPSQDYGQVVPHGSSTASIVTDQSLHSLRHRHSSKGQVGG